MHYVYKAILGHRFAWEFERNAGASWRIKRLRWVLRCSQLFIKPSLIFFPHCLDHFLQDSLPIHIWSLGNIFFPPFGGSGVQELYERAAEAGMGCHRSTDSFGRPMKPTRWPPFGHLLSGSYVLNTSRKHCGVLKELEFLSSSVLLLLLFFCFAFAFACFVLCLPCLCFASAGGRLLMASGGESIFFVFYFNVFCSPRGFAEEGVIPWHAFCECRGGRGHSDAAGFQNTPGKGSQNCPEKLTRNQASKEASKA